MECGICISNIVKSCHGSCSHHYCFNCLIRWCKKNNKCPKCRCVINEILLDPEFDELLYRLQNLSPDVIGRDTDIDIDTDTDIDTDIGKEIDDLLKITVCYDDNLPNNIYFYLTIVNNNGPGVVIKRAEIYGRAYHYGLRKKDIILYINNVPCRNHQMAIDIINYHDKCRKTMVFAILRH